MKEKDQVQCFRPFYTPAFHSKWTVCYHFWHLMLTWNLRVNWKDPVSLCIIDIFMLVNMEHVACCLYIINWHNGVHFSFGPILFNLEIFCMTAWRAFVISSPRSASSMPSTNTLSTLFGIQVDTRKVDNCICITSIFREIQYNRYIRYEWLYSQW